MSGIDPSTRARLARILGQPIASWTAIQGGYTPAERWRVHLMDGTTAFAKVGTTPFTAQALRDERAAYLALREADFVPSCLGFYDHPDRPVLVLEDLTAARWTPPWQPGDVRLVLDTLARVEAIATTLPSIHRHEGLLSGWTEVARDPAPFLSIGLCSAAWLDAVLPELLAAEASVDVSGDHLLHCDVRSDNLCLVDGPNPRAVLFDWNHACRGPSGFDAAFWAPSLRLEGGPLPEEVAPEAGVLSALVAGFFASNGGLPTIPDAPRVRPFQIQQLRVALPWTARVLGLPPPDGA